MKELMAISNNEYVKVGCVSCGSDYIRYDDNKIHNVITEDESGKYLQNTNRYKIVICSECGERFVISREELVENQKVKLISDDYTIVLKKFKKMQKRAQSQR